MGPALFTVASYAPIYVLSIILVLAGIASIPIFVKGDARRLANDESHIVVVEETSDGYTKTRLTQHFKRPERLSYPRLPQAVNHHEQVVQFAPSEQHCKDPEVRVQESARVTEARHLASRTLLRRHRPPQK